MDEILIRHSVSRVATKAVAAKPLVDTAVTRASYWQDVDDVQWLDWRWQVSHRLNTVEELNCVINLTDSEKEALSTSGLFRVDITPYFASLIDPDDPNCPVRKQVIPTSAELVPFESMMEDSLAEDKHSPVPGLVHRYPDRVLMLVTTQCASYCRYCTRSRIVGQPGQTFSRQDFEAQIAYIEQTPQIRDVLLSGGDPLVLAPKLLEMILSRLRAIPHVEIIRLGTRVPVFMPMRVTEELCEMLSQFHPLWVNIHVNHPKEITPELAAACDRLSRAGIPLGNQSVLLAGVNDSVHVQRKLVHELVKMRVRPYYLYQCDLVKGAGHFRTTVSKGIEIIEGLRGHTSGYAVPTYVVDAPGGGGKIPVMPTYQISQAPGKVVLRNFEGFISTYAEPEDYDHHAIKAQAFEQRPEPGQEGVLDLLEGHRLTIEPAGFEQTHARGGAEHRLRAGALSQKWQPLGVGEAGRPVLDPALVLKLVHSLGESPPVSQEVTLTKRELDICRQVAQGLSNQAIANRLVISERTVRSHIGHILEKLKLNNRTQLALYALRRGWATLEGEY